MPANVVYPALHIAFSHGSLGRLHGHSPFYRHSQVELILEKLLRGLLESSPE